MPRLYFDVILIRKPDTTTTFCYGLFLCRTSSFTFLKHVFMNNFTFHHDLNGRKRKICQRTTYTAQNKLILGSFTKKNPTLYFLQKQQKNGAFLLLSHTITWHLNRKAGLSRPFPFPCQSVCFGP